MLKKYIKDTINTKWWKLLLIYVIAIFVMFYLFMTFVNPVIAGFLSGLTTGWFIGFMVAYKYGHKLRIFIQG